MIDASQQYFETLNKRINEIGRDKITLKLKIGSIGVEIYFVNIKPAEDILSNLSFLLSDYVEKADEQVYVWEDDLLKIAPPDCMFTDNKLKSVYYKTDYYRFLMMPESGLQSSQDRINHITYVTFERGNSYPEGFINKPFARELQWWCMDHYIVLHAACIGCSGIGALILAPSGKGKSTLALGGMLNGMEYISEDYTLITKCGEIFSIPLYAAALTTEYTLTMLPQLKNNIMIKGTADRKSLIDLSGFKQSIPSEMKIRLLLYPIIGSFDEPKIIRVTSPNYFMTAIKSTAQKIRGDEFSDSFITIFQRLKNLPSFEIHLTTNAEKNTLCLKNFIETKTIHGTKE